MVRCLACGLVYEKSLEACPSRFKGPHTRAFMEKVAKRLADAGAYSVDQHLQIIKELRVEG